MKSNHLILIIFQTKTIISTIIIQQNVIDQVSKMKHIMIKTIGVFLQLCPFYYPSRDL